MLHPIFTKIFLIRTLTEICMSSYNTSKLAVCPGFGQDKVNFHWTPGRGTAGGWGLTPPGQTEPGIPYNVTVMLGSGGGGRRSRNSIVAWGGVAPVLFGRAAVWVVWFVVEFSPYLYRCCSCFPLFAVLLNCPYPDPLVSACFFSFSSARRQGEGLPRGAFVAGGSRNQNIKLAPRHGARITAGLSSGC